MKESLERTELVYPDYKEKYWIRTDTYNLRIDMHIGWDNMPLVKQGKIMDWGCSEGMTTIELSLIYPHCDILGIDVNPLVIELAKNRTNERVHFMEADGYELHFPPKAFNAIFCMNNLGPAYYCSEKDNKFFKKVIKSLGNIIADDGILFVSQDDHFAYGKKLSNQFEITKSSPNVYPKIFSELLSLYNE